MPLTLGSSLVKSELNFSCTTDKGLTRGNNEDCLLSLPENGLWLVADGMGGHEAGEVASAIVRDTVKSSIQSGEKLSDAIQQSHQAVIHAVNNGIGAAGMGSTVVAVRSDNQAYEVAWVGDSRAYLWSFEAGGGKLQQLTTDHSYVQMLLASGVINEHEVDNHPDKNVITQCIGSLDMETVQVDTLQGSWQENQWLLLCSDGLTDEVTDTDIATLLSNASNPKQAVNYLLNAALENGGRDNITIQVIESPLDNTESLPQLQEKKSGITGNRMLDFLIYGCALICLAFMVYWIVA